MTNIALVTGANKGIGFAIARGLAQNGVHVLLGSRDVQRGESAARELSKYGLLATPISLDITSAESIVAAASYVSQRFGYLDILVNNAGINLGIETVLETSVKDLKATFETNFFGPFLMIQTFWPLLELSESPRIVNVSSQLGSLTHMSHAMAAYCMSKAALNSLTRQAASLGAGKVSVNSICPGWVQTDLGGEGAPRTPEQGAAVVIELATMADPPTGRFVNEDGPLEW